MSAGHGHLGAVATFVKDVLPKIVLVASALFFLYALTEYMEKAQRLPRPELPVRAQPPPAPCSVAPVPLQPHVTSMHGPPATPPPAVALRSLADIGHSIKNDKVTVHRYHIAYEAYFEKLRNTPVKMLEIGLGCMGLKDVGLGVRLWGEYLSKAALTVVEYDGACAKEFLKRNKEARWGPTGGLRIAVGDQGNATFLDELGRSEGPWDIVIDDGSHRSEHQIASFRALFPYVARGGVYAIEDLQTSYWNGQWGGQGTAMHWIATELLPKVNTRFRAKKGLDVLDSKFKSDVARVDCHHFLCIVTKR